MKLGCVESVNLAVVSTAAWTGRKKSSGMDKRPTAGPTMFTADGVVGDTVVDRAVHGAWYQAAYAFQLEDLRYWSERLGKELVPGNAGENLTLSGFDASDALVGERWRIGGAVLRVTGPRSPCVVFAGFWDHPKLVKEFTAVGRPGPYLAVEQAGEISAGDTVELLDRPEHDVSVATLFAFLFGNREVTDRIPPVLEHLPQPWAEHTEKLLAGAQRGTVHQG
ncbi:MOSC domain-containing protein [Allokutzneria albata]|uniref:MOSC domain-containing protein YiiM n=1 Tax=Allokutzneria albata TaxID=211114 RepID=A0A1H0C728_ALLAB|nr:MOSC domain-containing protein [Allokutzneria albata]SDN53653.1 MOSC domain-containing protein YiiM [Allokutzneria albata]